MEVSLNHLSDRVNPIGDPKPVVLFTYTTYKKCYKHAIAGVAINLKMPNEAKFLLMLLC